MTLKNVQNNLASFRTPCHSEFSENDSYDWKGTKRYKWVRQCDKFVENYFKNQNLWLTCKQFPKRDIERSSVVGSDVMA